MPSGTQHTWIGCFILFVVNSIIIFTTQTNEVRLLCIFTNIFLFSTFYLSPDLDINSSVYKRWGLLKIIWLPYKKLFNHRQRSHGFITGPISLLLYLGLLLSPGFYTLYHINYQFPLTEILLSVTVIIFSVEAHIVADKLL